MSEILHIYRRVSTDVQEDEGYGLELQLEAGKEVARQLGFEIKLWDEGAKSSTKNDLTNRPVLDELLKDVESGKVDHLYAYNENRLSRNRATWYRIGLTLIDNGIKLYQGKSHQPRDLNSTEDAFIFSIMKEFSILEQSQRMERLKAGKYQRVKAGKWQGGPTPFGYDRDGDYICVNKEQADIVNLIYERYANGVSVKHISEELFSMGVRSSRGNSSFSTGSIERILKNTHYAGYFQYKDMRVSCERIVSDEALTLVKMRQKRNEEILVNRNERKFLDTNIKTETLLKKYLICGNCGQYFGQKINPKQYRNHYYCQGNERIWKKVGQENTCKGKIRSIKIEQTDKLVWSSVVNVISQSHLFKEMIKESVLAEDQPKISDNEWRKKNTKIKKNTETIRKAKNLIVDTESMMLLIDDDDDELDRSKRQIDVWGDRVRTLEVENKNIANEIAQDTVDKKWSNWIKIFDDNIEKFRSTDITFDEKKMLLDKTIESIKVLSKDKTTHQLHINFKMPLVNDTFEWRNEKRKKDGYTLKDGKYDLLIYNEEDWRGYDEKQEGIPSAPDRTVEVMIERHTGGLEGIKK